jgi:hypothetical protein
MLPYQGVGLQRAITLSDQEVRKNTHRPADMVDRSVSGDIRQCRSRTGAMRARRRPDLVDLEYVAQSIILQMICTRLYVSAAE